MKTIFAALRLGYFLTGSLIALSLPCGAVAQAVPAPYNPLLLEPTNGASYFSPAGVHLVLRSFSRATLIKFYANDTLIGVVSNGVSTAPPIPGYLWASDYVFDWSNVPAGNYALYADRIYAPSNASMISVRHSNTNTITVRQSHYLAVTLTTPTNGQVFPGPANTRLIAAAQDTNGQIAFAEFFDGSRPIGVVSNGAIIDPPGPLGIAYIDTWSNQTIGTHVLTAAVKDTNGQVAYSAPVKVIIGSNLPPSVQITSPPNHAQFFPAAKIGLYAFARDLDGYIASVEFFDGAKSLGDGIGELSPVAAPLMGVPPPSKAAPTNLFYLLWSNAPVGAHQLSAVATDDGGASTTSSPVNITILPPPPPPPTNLPDIVEIVATDPIAIASTDCWTWRGLAASAATWPQWASPASPWRWFTNCGPKDATLTVRRIGATKNDLLVFYAVGGTASNGVDYATLPGMVAIPAGQRTAPVVIQPIDNASNYVKTAVLMLWTPTDALTAYIIGFPARAEALIIDGKVPARSAATMLGYRTFHTSQPGPDGAWYHIDYTTNLKSWTTLCTNQVINGALDFSDPDAASSTNRMYRAVPLVNPPAD